ncbi:MAG TPA: gamma-glutamyltransferase, partial [Chitinophagaceae bacterium]|nr:gamma-glutamyltransferase [Chitinophagaceae bacterium]
TPGGATIITSVFQSIVDLLDFHLSLFDAVNKPKFHEQWLPDLIYIEKGFPLQTRKALEKMGYRFKVREAIGRTEAIEVLPDGKIRAVADHRGDDSALGY